MFRVLVVGGIALVGGSACGGSSALSADSVNQSGRPRVPAHPDVSGPADSDADTGFPAETNGSTSDGAVEGVPDADAGNDVAPISRPEAGAQNDAAVEAGRDPAGATCPPYQMKIGTGCFPIEGPQ
jgi:hypothetical protein